MVCNYDLSMSIPFYAAFTHLSIDLCVPSLSLNQKKCLPISLNCMFFLVLLYCAIWLITQTHPHFFFWSNSSCLKTKEKVSWVWPHRWEEQAYPSQSNFLFTPPSVKSAGTISMSSFWWAIINVYLNGKHKKLLTIGCRSNTLVVAGQSTTRHVGWGLDRPCKQS